MVVPCFTRWSKYDDITCKILTETFETIDHFNFLPRINVLFYLQFLMKTEVGLNNIFTVFQ